MSRPYTNVFGALIKIVREEDGVIVGMAVVVGLKPMLS
jgi:hypothetical protein